MFMFSSCNFLAVLSLCSVASNVVNGQAANGLDGDDGAVVGGYYKPGITAAQILRARGFLADEFFFTTKDGYILSIIRARNPLVNGGKGALAGKEPLLFIHGTTVSSSVWVTNSRGARPRDFTNIRVNATSEEDLFELVGDDPGSFSLPILFLNFGYEVWLLNRRGTLESENRVGAENRTLLDAFKSIVPTLFGGGFGPNLGLGVFDFGRPKNSSNLATGNKSHFSYNLTEQQERFLSTFEQDLLAGLLSGQLASPSKERPLDRSYINEFLQPFINLPEALLDFATFMRRFIRTFDEKFWAYSLDEQAKYDVMGAIDYVLQRTGEQQLSLVGHSVGGALPLLALSEFPELANKVMKAVLLAPALNLGHADIVFWQVIQSPFLQAYLGPIPFPFMVQQLQAILQVVCDFKAAQHTLCEGVVDLVLGPSGGQQPITPSIIASALQSVTGRELTHLAQLVPEKRPRKFKFNTCDENMRLYGSNEPPIYDLARIKLQRMSFYAGATDILVSPSDVRVTVSQLTAPPRFKLIGGPGVFFNHGGYFSHKQLNKLVAIPVLRDIEQLL